VLLFVTLAFLIEWNSSDFIVTDWTYSLQGGQWRLKSHFITSDVLHETGQKSVQIIGLLFLLRALISHHNTRLTPYRCGFWLLFLSLALGPLLVSMLKTFTHLDCPWDLLRYGGEHPYLPIFQSHPGDYDYGRCFPSGHASSGYDLLGLYFFIYHYKPKWRWIGLSIGMLVGLIFSIA